MAYRPKRNPIRDGLKLTLVAMMVLLFCVSSPAQEGDINDRIEDEKLITKDERERKLMEVLLDARVSREQGSLMKAADLLNRAGRLQLRLHLPEDSKSTYQNTAKLLRRSPSPAYIESLNGQAAVHAHLSQCKEAERVLDKALMLAERSKFMRGKAEGLLIRSDCQSGRDLDLALKTAGEALILSQSVNDKLGMGKTHSAMGHYYLAKTDLEAALKSQEAALTIWRELQVVPDQAEVLINLGFIEYRKGAWQKSLSFLTQAQAMLDEKAEPFKMGQINAGLGEAFIESGLPNIGLGKIQIASDYFRRANRPRSVSDMLWDLGRAYHQIGDYRQAEENLRQCLRDAQRIRNSYLSALCAEHLGRTYGATDKLSASLRQFQSALVLYRKVGSTMEAARTKALMAHLYQKRGQHDDARKHYRSALATFEKISDEVNGSATLYALGSLELEQNNLDLAERYFSESIAGTEKIRRISTSNDLTVAFSAAVHERYQSYIECLMRKDQAHPGQGFAIRAFETSEFARARSLAELLRATETNLAPGVDQKLVEQEKSIRQALRAKEDYKVALLGRDYKREELATLESDVARLTNEHELVVEAIQSQNPSYKQIVRPEAWHLRQIQEKVISDDQTLLLEFSLGKEKSYAWAVGRNHFRSYELPAEATIVKLVQELYRSVTANPTANDSGELTRAAEELSGAVIAPVNAELNRSRIIVVPDGALNYLPFQLLPKPGGDGEPLIGTYEIINTPSASILGGLRQAVARRQGGKLLAVFGDPVFTSNYAMEAQDSAEDLAALYTLEKQRAHQSLRNIQLNGDSFDPSILKPLLFAKIEIANLREVAEGGGTLIATDFDATREKLLNTDLTQYAVLHFATHGLLDPVHPEKSALVLSTMTRDGKSQNGYVSLQDIYQLRAPVNLVVLSACQTALGKDVRGEGLIGLTRGFMYAGASSVVASLWNVDDAATAELMKRFYTNMLKEGMPPAAALRAAQNSIRQEPQWSSPYYWAAFTLQGDYRQVIRPAQQPRQNYSFIVLIALVGSFALMILWWYLRVRGRRAKLP